MRTVNVLLTLLAAGTALASHPKGGHLAERKVIGNIDIAAPLLLKADGSAANVKRAAAGIVAGSPLIWQQGASGPYASTVDASGNLVKLA